MSEASKRTIDRLMIIAWLSFLFINVVNRFLVTYFGGIIVLTLYWVFACYFLFIYGKRQRDVKYNYGAALVFLVFFFIEMQLFFPANSGLTYYSMGVGFNQFVWQLLSFVPVAMACIGLLQRSDTNLFLWIRNSLLTLLIILSVFSIITLIRNPNASKATAMPGADGPYFPMLVGYSSTYAMAGLFPLMLDSFLRDKKKLFVLFSLIIIAVCVWYTTFFLAILAVLIGVLCYFLFRLKNTFFRIFCIAAVIGTLCYVMFSGRMVDILYDLSEFIPLENISVRLRETALAMSTGETGNSTVRFDIYNETLLEALKHPLVGNVLWNRFDTLGGHSTILDIFSAGGAVVITPLFIFFGSVLKYSTGLCIDLKAKSAVASSFIAFVFVSLFNPTISAPLLMIPIMLGVGLFYGAENNLQPEAEEEKKIGNKYIKGRRSSSAGYYKYKSDKER